MDLGGIQVPPVTQAGKLPGRVELKQLHFDVFGRRIARLVPGHCQIMSGLATVSGVCREIVHHKFQKARHHSAKECMVLAVWQILVSLQSARCEPEVALHKIGFLMQRMF